MAFEQNVKEKAKRFLEEVKKNKIRICKAYLYGSYAKGTAHKDSDIDIALISEDFTGNRFYDSLRIIPLRRKIDIRIEPVTYKPEDFDDSDPLVDEIKKAGIEL